MVLAEMPILVPSPPVDPVVGAVADNADELELPAALPEPAHLHHRFPRTLGQGETEVATRMQLRGQVSLRQDVVRSLE